jgi:hypothetical protein
MPNIEPHDKPKVMLAVHNLLQKQQFDDALPILENLLADDPNCAASLNFLGYIYLSVGKEQIAYQYFRRALQEEPNNKSVWSNFGMSAYELNRDQEALNSFLKAAAIDHDYSPAYSNAAAVLVRQSRWEEGKKSAEMSLECDPKDKNASMNLSHCYLAVGDYDNGWKYWGMSLGGKFRKEWTYGEEPRWDGSKGKSIVVYGEQGLGDEIMYASCLPEVIADCERVYIDCDKRLEGLFRRSFPQAEVHGTRIVDHPEWLETAYIEARASIGSIPEFYRRKDSDFPRKPYLVADPERRRMWRALFDSYGKPVIGITTHGGGKLTNQDGRKIDIDDWKPLFDAIDAVWVSLDYKGNPEGVKAFDWATKTQDQDDLAALIAELDGVIGINTAALHLAGGLGVPIITMVSKNHQWRYARTPYLWSGSTELWYQGEKSWFDTIDRLAKSKTLEKFKNGFR